MVKATRGKFMVWETTNSNGWIFVDDQMPNDGEFVLAISGEDSPIGITRFIDGEWEGRRLFTKTERLSTTTASVVYWMPLPKQPERSKREDPKGMRCSEHDRNAVKEVQ